MCVWAKRALGALVAVLVAFAVVCASPREARAADEWVITENGTVQYIKDDGTPARMEWVQFFDSWCWFGPTGVMEFSWTHLNGSWYLYFADGTPYTGWAYFADGWYWFDDYGRLALSEWVCIDDEWFYFNGWGRMATDCWVNTSGYWAYVDAAGHPLTGWQLIDGQYYCFTPDGVLIVDTWAPYGNVFYRMTADGTVSLTTYPVEAVKRSVRTSKGTVQGYQLVPQGVKSAPILIYSHGLGGSGTNFLAHGLDLGGTGISTFYFDYIGGSPSSASGGDFLEMSIDTEKAQLEAIIMAVKTWSGVNSRKVFLVGHSQGGLVSTLVASKRSDIAGLILLSPAFNLGDMLRSEYGSLDNIGSTFTFLGKTLGRQYAVALWDVTERSVLEGYSGDALVFHGTADEVIDMYVSVRTKFAWGNSCNLVLLSDLSHNAVLWHNATVVSRIYNYVQTHESSAFNPWWPRG